MVIVLDKTSTILDELGFGDINSLYKSVDNRAAAEAVIGARSIYPYCQAYKGFDGLPIFITWLPL